MYNYIKKEEEDFLEFLSNNKFHPLNFMNISNIQLIGKTQEYKLYQFYNEDREQMQTLKVMSNSRLFNLEKAILDQVSDRRITIPLINDFTFEQ